MLVAIRTIALALCATVLCGCATSPGRYAVQDTSQQRWTVHPKTIGKIPSNGQLFAIKKDNGRWVKAKRQDENAELIVLTTDKQAYLYTKGASEELFLCGFNLVTKAYPGCRSSFVGKAKFSEHIGDFILFPIAVIPMMGYLAVDKLQTDKLAAALQQAGLLDSSQAALDSRAHWLATEQQMQRNLKATQQQFQAFERATYAQLTFKQGVGGKICQSYKDSHGRAMERIAFVERIQNNRIQLRTSAVRFENQPSVAMKSPQQILWDDPGHWYPCH